MKLHSFLVILRLEFLVILRLEFLVIGGLTGGSMIRMEYVHLMLDPGSRSAFGSTGRDDLEAHVPPSAPLADND
jgi:hypothetical protein